MITTTIEWHKPSEKLPEWSGDYIVRTPYQFIVATFSKRYQRFNTHDDYDTKQMERTALPMEFVECWAEIPAFPKNESEGE